MYLFTNTDLIHSPSDNMHSLGGAVFVLAQVATANWAHQLHDSVPADASWLSVGLAYAYFASFLVLGHFVMLNLFVAVVLETVEQAALRCRARAPNDVSLMSCR